MEQFNNLFININFIFNSLIDHKSFGEFLGNKHKDVFDKLKSFEKPVIAVCRSGARSGQATNFLKQNGVDVINGGPWQNVDQYL